MGTCFHLFGPQRQHLSCEQFAHDDDVQHEVLLWITQQPKEFYATGIRALIRRWEKGINVAGCCMKGILETGGVMGQCVQMWTRNYGALDQTARVCFGVLCANRKKEEVKRDFGPANKKERGACCEHTPGV
ncbi:uncharacterized protein TNCV_1277931 [Trichonephila clavipes]|nr:uncharacterized protein TNCV_1277931 [Trichonephila clavipes]